MSDKTTATHPVDVFIAVLLIVYTGMVIFCIVDSSHNSKTDCVIELTKAGVLVKTSLLCAE